MKENIKKILSYLAIGLALLGVIMIYGTFRAKAPANGYILSLGFLLLIPAVVMLLIERYSANRSAPVPKLSDLKYTGIQIPVDLTQCTVVGNEWTTERPKEHNAIIVMNELTGNSYDNRESSNTVLSRVTCTQIVNGAERTFVSRSIARDKQTLHLLLEMEKVTSIYIDRDDPKYYYFDLEFITSNSPDEED
jgi:hypothetical protein